MKELSALGENDHFSILGVLFISIWDMSQTASWILCWMRKKWFSRIPWDSWQLMTPASCSGLTFAVNMTLTGCLMYIYGPGAVRLSPCFCLASFRVVAVSSPLFFLSTESYSTVLSGKEKWASPLYGKLTKTTPIFYVFLFSINI